jgi:hypothetical protein
MFTVGTAMGPLLKYQTVFSLCSHEKFSLIDRTVHGSKAYRDISCVHPGDVWPVQSFNQSMSSGTFATNDTDKTKISLKLD